MFWMLDDDDDDSYYFGLRSSWSCFEPSHWPLRIFLDYSAIARFAGTRSCTALYGSAPCTVPRGTVQYVYV